MGKSAAKRPKTRKVLNLAAGGPVIKTVKVKSRRRRAHHVQNFPPRSEYKHILKLTEADQKELDQLRDDLQASIERTVRVHGRFVEELNKHAVGCNRKKAIVKSLVILPFHSDCQRKVVDEGIRDILRFDLVAAQLAEEAKEAAEKKRKRDETPSANRLFFDKEYRDRCLDISSP